MDNYTATGLAEGFIHADSEDQLVEAWQHLIDTGLAWTLQGFFGRQATALIKEGICHPAAPHYDPKDKDIECRLYRKPGEPKQ